VWQAHALEMDIVAEGATFEKATEELMELVGMQISFAMDQDDPDLIYKPAPPHLIQRFAEVRQKVLSDAIRQNYVPDDDWRVSSLPFPPFVRGDFNNELNA